MVHEYSLTHTKLQDYSIDLSPIIGALVMFVSILQGAANRLWHIGCIIEKELY